MAKQQPQWTTTLKPMLLVSEIFGPTIQGEGPSTGRPCAFLRLGGCNLKCVWCDTPYTWDATRFDLSKELTRMTYDEVIAQIATAMPAGVRTLVVSGGEPLLQDLKLAGLFDHLFRTHMGEMRIEVETAGTLVPVNTWPFVHQFNVSPKLAHSGNAHAKRFIPEALNWFANSTKTYFKFVCVTDDDLGEVDGIVSQFKIKPERVYIMPEGVTVEATTEHMQALAPQVIARGYNLTQRLQISIWGNRRGT